MKYWSWRCWFGMVVLSLFSSIDPTEEVQGRMFRRGTSYNEQLVDIARPLRDTVGQLEPNTNTTTDKETKGNSMNNGSKKKTAQYIILPPDYNKFKLPWRSAAEPMQVEIMLEIRKVLGFDEQDEQMTLDLDLVVGWTDFKIFDYRPNGTTDNFKPKQSIHNMTRKEINDKKRIINDPDILASIWKPNIIFENLISIKKPYVMATPVKLKVIPEAGFIQYITRLSVTVDCGMKFEYYPADTQTCEFSVRPYSYTSKLVRLNWHKQLGGVWLNDNTLPSFDVRADDLHEKFLIDTYEDTEKVFHVLTFNIHVRRKLSYHLVQTYLASGFYIIITCLCFLIPPRMVEARIGISMTTLLTLTAMFAAVRESTPITSYVKAIDTWMVCCIFFVFLTLAQFTFYTWLRGFQNEAEETDKKDQEKLKIQENNLEPHSAESHEVEIKPGAKRGRASLTSQLKYSAMKKYEHIAFFIEKFSFVIFLSIFGMYSFLYWIWLLLSSDYYNWNVNPTMNYVKGHDYGEYLSSIKA